MDRVVEQPLAPTLGGFAIPRILFDVGDHTRIEDHLPIVRRIKATIEVEVGAFEVQTDLFGHAFQSGDSPELAQGLPYKGKSMRNRGFSSPMPFLLIPRSLLRGGFISDHQGAAPYPFHSREPRERELTQSHD